MTDEITVRRFRPQDIQDISKLWKEKPVVVSGLLADNEKNCNNWIKWIVRRHEVEPDSVIIAEKQGRIVGMYVCACSMTNIHLPNFPPLVEKNLIAWGSDWLVAPEERGRGLGKRLLAEAIGQAKSKEATEFRGNVHPVSTQAERTHKASGSKHKSIDLAKEINVGLPHKQIQNLRIQKGYSAAIARFFEPWLQTGAIGDFERTAENKKKWLEWARTLATNEEEGVLVAYQNKNPVGCLLGSARENECQGLVYKTPSGRVFGLTTMDPTNLGLKHELLATFIDYLIREKVQVVKLFTRKNDELTYTFLKNLGFKPYRFMHTLFLK